MIRYKNNDKHNGPLYLGPFPFMEEYMKLIPIAAALLVKALLEWWLEDK